MDSGLCFGCRALRDRACVRRQARGEGRLSRCARGVGVFACDARFGPVPLPPGVCGWVGRSGTGSGSDSF